MHGRMERTAVSTSSGKGGVGMIVMGDRRGEAGSKHQYAHTSSSIDGPSRDGLRVLSNDNSLNDAKNSPFSSLCADSFTAPMTWEFSICFSLQSFGSSRRGCRPWLKGICLRLQDAASIREDQIYSVRLQPARIKEERTIFQKSGWDWDERIQRGVC